MNKIEGKKTNHSKEGKKERKKEKNTQIISVLFQKIKATSMLLRTLTFIISVG